MNDQTQAIQATHPRPEGPGTPPMRKAMRRTPFGRLLRDRRGAALAEYGLLVAGVALMGMAAVSVLGGRVSDMIGVVANLLPSASVENSAPVATGQIIETTSDDGVARLDGSANVHNADQGYSSLQQAVGMHRTADGQHGWGHTVQRNGQSAPTID